jgi:putative flippase GtrA
MYGGVAIKNSKIIRYFFVGGFSAIINLGIFSLLTKILDINYLLASASSFTAATSIGYMLTIQHVFQSGARFGRKKEIFWTFTISLMGLFFDLCIIFVCVELLYIEAIASKIIATGLVFFWNYFARSRFLFKEQV